ncbi:hypothetical protein F4821DRAFT_213217 [Hypoxylon rubiginosum]|uniref:Uncharacterized protein n=1 Tax=Hypoxylon rubiginosum TaxID=110542 RepID=A0ACC0CQ74_9PEZI|nr:hypothetical protein F4821DRAFT_213217 [Hypoxylon rubiginosum]
MATSTNKPQYALSRTLALTDAASGTTPLSHMLPTVSLLKADIRLLAAAVPRIFVAVIKGSPQTSWAEWRETVFYLVVSLIELQLFVSLCLLWLVVPGVALLPWLGVQVALVWWIILRWVNSQSRPFVSPTDRLPSNDTIDDELERCDWFVVGGLVNNAQMRRTVLPRLARIFGDDMHIYVFPHYRLGFPLDVVIMLLQRNLHMPTARSVALYSAIRASILNPKIDGVRVIAHNTGALDVSWLLSSLCADLPAGGRLSKLQVFTFGAASVEMTLPLGKIHSHDDGSSKFLYPDVTHFAFADDPMAKVGVLYGIRQRLEGRLVGSLYTVQTAAAALPRACQFTLGDYLDVLLPDGNPRAGVLGQACKIDRELSEMRELAALVKSVTNERLRTRDVKRRSWTILGMVADDQNHDTASPFSLTDISRTIKSLDGLKGYEDNPLAEAIRNKYRIRPGERNMGTK